jgi:hypothetical protein
MAEAAIVQILPQLQIGNQSLGQALGQQQEQAEARALQQGVPSTSLVMRVLRDVAHELAGRRKAQREKDFASAGKGALSGFGALRAALESPPEGTVDRLIIEEAKLDQAPDEIPRPQPGHHDSARYPSVEESHEGPLYASSEAHARQQGLPGVGEDAREVEGPVEASSLAHARQQGLPGVGEQDAREVGGYDDDEADYGDNDSEASQGPASDAECWLGDPSDLNYPRWGSDVCGG